MVCGCSRMTQNHTGHVPKPSHHTLLFSDILFMSPQTLPLPSPQTKKIEIVRLMNINEYQLQHLHEFRPHPPKKSKYKMRLTKQHQPQYDTPPYPSTAKFVQWYKVYYTRKHVYTYTRIHTYTYTRIHVNTTHSIHVYTYTHIHVFLNNLRITSSSVYLSAMAVNICEFCDCEDIGC